jgi:hypothetical protein
METHHASVSLLTKTQEISSGAQKYSGRIDDAAVLYRTAINACKHYA